MQAMIITAFGKVIRVEVEQGLHFQMPCNTERKTLSLAINTMQVRGSSVPDSTGSPMDVSSIINYVITDPIAAEYNVENLHSFIHNQAQDTVRRVCSKFRYRATQQKPDEPSLIDDGHHVAKHMAQLMNHRCKVAGVEIMRMVFIDIAYVPEIAA